MSVRTVVCFGDSNTHGTIPHEFEGDSRRHPYEDRWTTVLGERLGPGYRVIPEGHPGRTTVLDDPIEGTHKSGVRALLAILESHRPIDILVIMLGTNDLKSRFNLTAGEIAKGVEKLVAMARATPTGPDGQAPAILVVAPPALKPTGVLMDLFEGGPDKSQRFATAFAQMGVRIDAPVFDAGSVASMSDIEGVHMDAANHRLLGEALAGPITQLAS